MELVANLGRLFVQRISDQNKGTFISLEGASLVPLREADAISGRYIWCLLPCRFLRQRMLVVREGSNLISAAEIPNFLCRVSRGPKFAEGTRDLVFLQRNVQPGCGAGPASYTMLLWVLFLGVKRPGCGADHSPPSSSINTVNWLFC